MHYMRNRIARLRNSGTWHSQNMFVAIADTVSSLYVQSLAVHSALTVRKQPEAIRYADFTSRKLTSAKFGHRPKSDIHCHSYQPAASRCKATIGDSSEQSIQFFNWHGLAEQIALKIHTPVFLQEVQLLLGLNPFRDNLNSE